MEGCWPGTAVKGCHCRGDSLHAQIYIACRGPQQGLRLSHKQSTIQLHTSIAELQYLERLLRTEAVHLHVQTSQLPCRLHAGNMKAHWESLLDEPEGDIEEVQGQCCTRSPGVSRLAADMEHTHRKFTHVTLHCHWTTV